MLEFVRGEVLSVGEDGAVISLGGVGLRVQMPTGDLAQLDGVVTVHTVLHVRDDDVQLFGFANTRGRELFNALTSVSGVGPKVALAILSFHTPESLERTIASGDADALLLVSGVGKKTAGRILLDLKDMFGAGAEIAAAPSTSALGEVREGLKNMGFSTQEIQDVLTDLPSDGDVPTLLRHALKTLGAHEKAELN